MGGARPPLYAFAARRVRLRYLSGAFDRTQTPSVDLWYGPAKAIASNTKTGYPAPKINICRSFALLL